MYSAGRRDGQLNLLLIKMVAQARREVELVIQNGSGDSTGFRGLAFIGSKFSGPRRDETSQMSDTNCHRV